jgi:GNAT superfamily N-acetyltransferase
MMNYRMATEDDAVQLAEMRWDFRTEGKQSVPAISKEEFIAACTEFLKQGLSAGEWVHWIAETDQEIVAHIFVRRVRKVPKPSRLRDEYGYLTNVYTRPAYRGRGIGSKLLERVVTWAREEDLDTLIVWPSEESVAFYERAGFTGKNELLEHEIRLEVD